ATVCTSRSLIGQHAHQFYINGRDMVRSDDTATDIEGCGRGGEEKVRPYIRHNVDAYPQEDTIASHRGFYIQAMASAMVCQHVLAPLFNPLDRTSEAYGEIRDQHIFGKQAILDHKAAA